MTYTASNLLDAVNEYGEVLVTLESGRELELHLHDTTISDEGEVTVELSDGVFAFTADRVESLGYHTQSHGEL